MHGSADMAWRSRAVAALQVLLDELDEHDEMMAAVHVAEAIEALSVAPIQDQE